MADPKSKKNNTAPRHLKAADAPQRAMRKERTAAHRAKRPPQRSPEERRAAEHAPERPVHSAYVGKRLYYERLLPYAEERHAANQRALKAGIRWMFVLPLLLLVFQKLTDQSRIGVLLVWIVGMFIIAGAILYISCSDHELQRYLQSVAEFIPEAEDASLGSLLPVDEDGNWTISAEQLRGLLAQYRMERREDESAVRLPHELPLKLRQDGEEGRHEKHAAYRP